MAKPVAHAPNVRHPVNMDGLNDHDRLHAQASLNMAARLYADARNRRTRHERALDGERARLVGDAEGKETLMALMDQAFRSKLPATTADQMTRILRERGIPRHFSAFERFGLLLFRLFAAWFPWLFVPVVKAVMARKTREVILPGEFRQMVRHVRTRRAQGVRLTVNNLGEMILGEGEADAKTRHDVALLTVPVVECISVKASNLYSQVTALAHERSVAMMMERLRPRLAAAKANRRRGYSRFAAPRWDKGYKLVNLDMEEYRDMAITVDAFKRVLDEPEFLDLQASLAIQAYIPDSFGVVEDLLTWAKDRVERGGAPIRIRVVKGANRAMELVDSSLRGLPCPTYDDKVDSDANWKSIVELISRRENIAACHLGIATHNVFDLCWAALLIRERGVGELVTYEMLEGMVNHVHREVQKELGEVLLYAPVVTADKFLTAIAYLMRRFDELTDPRNFLSHIFGITPEAPEWDALAEIFVESIRRMPTVSHGRHREQDRAREDVMCPSPATPTDFVNEPDTDWTSASNRRWLEERVITKVARLRTGSHAVIPLTATAAVTDDDIRDWKKVNDRSLPDTAIGIVELAREEDVDDVLETAVTGAFLWAELPADERDGILAAAAASFRRHRPDFLALAAADMGKPFDQADGETSEAVDFGVLYPLAAAHFRKTLPHVGQGPIGNGVVVVVSPWNFPIAIPSGGVFAALAAGNAVILKPSSESRLVTTSIAECFWEAGVPRSALQVLNCDHHVAANLVADPRVAAVIFTGSTGTADRILAARPERPLFAETGGKNATIVTGRADRELAIKHVADSFRNDGQKCSATSLLLLTPELYEDAGFLKQLVDAVASLPVGPADDPASVVTPLFRKPGPALFRGLTTLEEGEAWLLEPRRMDGREDFWTPGIKTGVKRGSFMHRAELFGPVLAVMRVADLREALEAIKETGFGLTLGIESLDAREVQYVVDNAAAGVVYCNRNTVGAIVSRQTFGGWRDSRRGPGIHAGGLNYVTNFLTFTEPGDCLRDPPAREVTDAELAMSTNPERGLAVAALVRSLTALNGRTGGYDGAVSSMRSILEQWVDHFSKEHRPGRKIRGEDNVHRYRPLGPVTVRVTASDEDWDILTRIAAAIVAGNDVTVSSAPGCWKPARLRYAMPALGRLGVKWVRENDDALASRLAAEGFTSLRYAKPERVPDAIWRFVAENPRVYVGCRPVLRTARLEMLNYLQEQTVSLVYHRYGGNLRDDD